MFNNETEQTIDNDTAVVPNAYMSMGETFQDQQVSLKSAFSTLADTVDINAITTSWLRKALKHRPLTRQQSLALIERAIVDIDKIISEQIDLILHHQKFQRLEASWRSLFYLVETKSEYDEDLTVKIKVLDVSWPELAKDVTRAIEFDQSQAFQRIYSDEFDMPGGEPFGAILGDYQISHRARRDVSAPDVEVLANMSKIATAALCPFIVNASSRLFGLDSLRELGQPFDLTDTFNQKEYIKWNNLRQQEDMRFIGVTMPDVLMREPYQDDGTRYEGFTYREKTVNSEVDYLWGNACYAFGGVLIRAFANTGWFADIRGGVHSFGEGGVVKNLVYPRYKYDKAGLASRLAANVHINDYLERELSDIGLIPLCSYHSADHSVFYSNNSMHEPIHYKSDVANINARLSSMIQYMLCVSRFGHYIKVMIRDKIGSFATADECEKFLQNWLNQYTTSSDMASSDLKARYPLGACKVEVHENPARNGYFTCVAYLQPHFQLDQMVSSIRLVTELAVGTNTGKAS